MVGVLADIPPENRAGDRSCKLAIWSGENPDLLFVCFEGKTMQCTIHLSAESAN